MIADPPVADAREADQAARLAAQRELVRPLVLEAGAGTGKTTTLVARILAWCLGPGWEKGRERRRRPAVTRHGATPAEPTYEQIAVEVLSRVVAITFTEAAAAEMADRVAEDLARIAGGLGELPGWLDSERLPPGPERVARARALVGTLDHLAVRTIHAFCLGLLAAHPLEAGRHPSLTVDADGRLLETIAREAVEARLREGYGDPGDPDLLALAAQGYGPPEILEALLTLAIQGLGSFALERDPLAGNAIPALGRRLAAAGIALEQVFLDFPASGRGKGKGNLPLIEAGLVALLQRLASDAGNVPDVATLRAWVSELLPKNLADHIREWGKGKLSSQTEKERLGDAVGSLAPAAAGLCRLLTHLERLDPALLSAARRALAPLLARVEGELRSRGIETFPSLLSGAATLLARHPEVRSRVRKGIDQLLIDEFQDTDREQCDILRLLALDGPPAERPGLFLVGDPKQSIYGWRSADLAAYQGFVDLVKDNGGLVFSLVLNFRSVPPILEEVARVIQPVMRPVSGLQPPFEPLLPCEARAGSPGFHHEGPAGRARRPVEYWVSWKGRKGKTNGEPESWEVLARTRPGAATELEAEAVAADLLDLHTHHGVSWKEIGLLLRSNTDLDLYLEALRRARIPFLVGRDKQYYRRREVIEAAALVRAVLDPGDHLALLTVLRSAAVGVPDAALLPLWSRRFPGLATDLTHPDPERLAEIAAAIEAAARQVPEDVPGIERLRGWEANLLAAVEALAHLRHSWETEPADLFLERLRRLFLLEATESARYLGAYRLANLDRFFRQLQTALEEGGGDVTGVLRLLRRSVAESEEAEEGRPREGGEDAVSVLTIHGAKGLDFRHVYLLQLHKHSRIDRPDGTEVGVLPGAGGGRGRVEYRVFGAATPGFDEIEAERAAVEAAERVRTLYVAMTRAKDRLVLAGAWPLRDTPVDPAQARTHVDLLLSRPAVPALPALFDEAAGQGTWSQADETGALWYLPDLHPRGAAPELEREPPDLPTAQEVRRGADLLAAHREGARKRMARKTSIAASEEAHDRLRALQAERRFAPEEEKETAAPPAAEGPDHETDHDADREAAMAAGGAVHRALETWDLEADPAAELARQLALLPSYLAALLGDADPDPAQRRAAGLLKRFAAGPLLPRLRAIGSDVLARELAVFLPPGSGEGAPVGYVAGAIDLLYKDGKTGAVVVADYKTDDVQDDAALEARAAAYAPQGAAYVKAVAEALGLPEPPRFELWFLVAGRVLTPL